MKGFYFVISALFFLFSADVLAKEHNINMKKNQWVCETNASRSSNAADQKADDMMKKSMSGKDAFEFAMKHCRDCNKITCKLQTEQNTNQKSS